MLTTTVGHTDLDGPRLAAARQEFLAWPTSRPAGVTPSEFAGIVADLADVPLPSADDVESVASVLRAGGLSEPAQHPRGVPGPLTAYEDHVGAVREGRTWHLGLSPGVVSLRSFDAARAERTAARAVGRRESVLRETLGRAVRPQEGPTLLDGDLLPVGVLVDELRPRDPYGAVITEWSAKSRARMVKTLAQLDLSTWKDDGGDLGMLTLTLPGDWQAVAPDGKTFKRHIERFRRRFVRATGQAWRVIWKLEFQDRGAPHMHLLMRIPALVQGEPFEVWASRTWADVVQADDVTCHRCIGEDVCSCEVPDTERRRHLAAGTGVDFAGGRYRDPRRIALYFLGHSSKHTDGKEYQHRVPLLWQQRGRGPGRFWGYSGLDRAVVEVELSQAEAVIVRRIMRKVHAARAGQRDRARAARGLPALPRRKVWTLGSGGAMSGGWVLMNEAIDFVYDLARYLESRRT